MIFFFLRYFQVINLLKSTFVLFDESSEKKLLRGKWHKQIKLAGYVRDWDRIAKNKFHALIIHSRVGWLHGRCWVSVVNGIIRSWYEALPACKTILHLINLDRKTAHLIGERPFTGFCTFFKHFSNKCFESQNGRMDSPTKK